MNNRLYILFPIVNQNELTEVVVNNSITEIVSLAKNINPLVIPASVKIIDNAIDYKEISSNAIQHYTDFVANFSTTKILNNQTIRAIKYVNLPLYWLTPFAIKHPYLHWLYNNFLMKEFLSSSTNKTLEHNIYLPKQYAYLNDFLASFYTSFKVSFLGQKKSPQKSKMIKNHLLNVYKILKTQTLKKNNQKHETVFFDTGNKSSYIGKIFETFKENNVLPNNAELVQPFNWKFNLPINAAYCASKPSLKQLLGVLKTSLTIKTLLKKYNKNITVNGISFNTNIVLIEIENILTNKSHLLYNYLWLTNYFKKNRSTKKVFFEDEFYVSGRLISAAQKNTNSLIKTMGVQHGFFSDFHTVYHISDAEINELELNKNDGLPLPSIFITWGDYFSEQFLKNNSLNKTFVRAVGNPLYLFDEHIKKQPNEQFTILYCLTSETLFYKELPIVQQLLKNYKDVKLVVRNHPNFKFTVSQQLFNKHIKVAASSNSNLNQDMAKADLILTSAHSTIFLDAIHNQTPVLRLKTNIADSSMDINSSFCKTITEHDIITSNNNEIYTDELSNLFLYQNKEGWLDLIKI